MNFSLYHKCSSQLSSWASKTFFWWSLLALLLAPFFILILFNHASADDYCYVVASMKKGFWSSQWNTYVSWSGRYISSILISSCPLLYYSFTGYKIVNFLLIAWTALSALYFVKVLLNKKTIDLPVVGVTFGLLFLYFTEMPNLTEGFYWLSGAITYQLANISMITVVTLLLSMKQDYSKWKVIAALVLCIMICGANETAMLEFGYVLVALMVLEYTSTGRIPRYYFLLLLVSLLSGSITVLAPGNAVRAAYFQGEKNILNALVLSIGSGWSRLVEWLHDIVIVLVLFLPFLKQAENSSSQRISPWVLILYPLFILGILIVGFFPAYWSVGFEPPSRTVNVLYWVFLVSCFHYAVLWVFYVKQKDGVFVNIPGYVLWILAFLLFRNWAPANHFRTASMDLISGRAEVYDREMEERYVLMDQHKGEDLQVKPLSATPKSIFFSEIEPGHPEDWKNVCTADYFYLKSIDLKKELPNE